MRLNITFTKPLKQWRGCSIGIRTDIIQCSLLNLVKQGATCYVRSFSDMTQTKLN